MNRQSVVEPRFGGAYWSNQAPSDKLQPLLEAGERLLWSGRPQRGLMLRPSDVYLIPFSLLWCGFVVFWETGVLKFRAPGFFPVFGAFFVMIGLHFVFGRFITDAIQRRRTAYGITNQRVIILSGLWRSESRSLYLEGLTEIALLPARGGRGTLKFGRDLTPMSAMQGWPGSRNGAAPAFEGIEAPANVLSIIRAAQKTMPA